MTYKVFKMGKKYKAVCYLTEHTDHAPISADELLNLAPSEKRLASNVSRARSKVLELALCNQWDYFATFTIDCRKADRYDLGGFIRRFGYWIGNYNKKYQAKLKYLLVPEAHKDGAIHAHALLSGVSPLSLTMNANGHYEIPYYSSRFGFMSIEPLRDADRASFYITKYVTKDFARARHSGEHLYYASKGLERKEEFFGGELLSVPPFSFCNDYVALEWADDFEELMDKLMFYIKDQAFTEN